MSRIILTQIDRILHEVSDTVLDPMRRRQPLNKILRKLMNGREATEIARRAQSKNVHLTKSAVNQILNGNTKNPQIDTCEALAAGLDMTPLQFIAELLGERLDDPVVRSSKLSALVEIYEDMTPTQKQKADPHIEGTLFLLRGIKNQPK